MGIDVGGTFTKAVALDLKTGDILGKSTVLTTHTSEKGVSQGIIKVLDNVMKSSNTVSYTHLTLPTIYSV